MGQCVARCCWKGPGSERVGRSRVTKGKDVEEVMILYLFRGYFSWQCKRFDERLVFLGRSETVSLVRNKHFWSSV